MLTFWEPNVSKDALGTSKGEHYFQVRNILLHFFIFFARRRRSRCYIIAGRQLFFRSVSEFRMRLLDLTTVLALYTLRLPGYLQVIVKPLGEGQGFISVVYRVTVEFTDASAAPFNFVLKVPSTRHLETFVSAAKDPEVSIR